MKRLSRVERRWGYYETLYETASFKVKRLVVLPGKKLSLQRHEKRREVWVFPNGDLQVVPIGGWHQLKNPGKETLEVIEVQTGEYFGEDDIERGE